MKNFKPQNVIVAMTAIGILLPLVAVVMLRQIEGFGVWGSIDSATWVYIAIWYAALYSGLSISTPRFSPRMTVGFVSNAVLALSICATVGAGLLMYEFAVGRGFGFNTPLAEIRITVINNVQSGFTGAWTSALGRVLVAALPVAWVMAGMAWTAVSRVSLSTLLVSSLIVFFEQATFEGGRFFFVFLILATLVGSVAALISEGLSGRFSVRFLVLQIQPVILSVALAGAMVFYSSYTFVSRVEDRVEQMEAQQAVQPAPPPSDAQKAPPSEDQPASPSPHGVNYSGYVSVLPLDISDTDLTNFAADDYSAAMTWVYVTHGLSEFDLIFQKDDFNHALGAYQFPQLVLLATKLSGVDLRYDERANLPNYAVYTTLPGASYIDFGLLGGLVFAFLIGLGMRAGINDLGRGSAELVAPILFVVAVVGPSYSLFPNVWPSLAWVLLISLLAVALRRLKPAVERGGLLTERNRK